ncbi:MAG: EthD family reductase [Azospirillaceae bacterium]|nr:EthD family reductase [Azospirillaceae bacterium]
MIKVSVVYANKPGARFDHAYYRDTHMPLVQRLLGGACLYYTVDKGLSGDGPDVPPPYVGMCHIFSESPETFWAAFGAHAEEIVADIANYTDLAPVLQVSEVVVDAPR